LALYLKDLQDLKDYFLLLQSDHSKHAEDEGSQKYLGDQELSEPILRENVGERVKVDPYDG
jgi:hypothetical protein